MIFKKYAGSGYSSKNPESFDQLGSKHKEITLAELLKCLKENHILPSLITKKEASTVLRKINISQSDLKSTDFEGFVFYLLQVAMLVFSRNPINLSARPPAELIKRLLRFFEESFEERGESTTLF